MVTFFRHWLDEHELGAYEDFLPQFKKVAEGMGLRGLEPAKTTFHAWYYGKRKPQGDSRRVLVSWANYSLETLWTEVPPGTVPNFPHLSSASPLAHHADPIGMDMINMKRTGAMAVQRAKEFLMGADRDSVGEDTLGLLGDEVIRLVGAYPRQPLSDIWGDLLTAQDQIFRTLEGGRVRQPSKLRDLNYQAAVVSFLVAKGFNDLEDRAQAMTMTRVAAACARDAEHQGLMALVEGLRSLIAYWADKPTDAYHYAQRGVEMATNLNGTVKLWLLGLQSRAAAVQGDEETARTASRQAGIWRESVVFDDLDRLGGLFTYSEPKQLYYTVEAETLLGNGDPRLAAQAEDAVHSFSDQDTPFWAFGDLAGAQCNLALIRLHAGHLDGAAEAIRPVLQLPVTHRNNGIVVSAQRVRQALNSGPVRAAIQARSLREEIEIYPPQRSTGISVIAPRE
ncbi:hypothetical protein QF026_001462 [Streptomyces aurantiacus]|uniref:hypothetical protein n=1 Tax=Streptomyces aurantiacus TaxID=47760 RepID=UPI00279384BB|nr:hypothetical protein [Streptomyces aurantiacus]MDQ0772996.1 hypothetical protein [Streptomyces aurantiacus]